MNKYKIAALEVEIISLTARSKQCRDFCLNKNLQIEADLLDKQIEALNNQLNLERSNHV